MVRKLAGVVFAVSTLHASVVSALGLGELELQSGLNQPLQAEIALNNLGDLSEQQVAVKLAGTDDFARAGVERIYFLSDLKFAVTLDGKGNGTVVVSSKKLVREPYLDFILEARWPSGRLLREYTVLVDMPTFSDAVVAAPAPASSQQTRQTAATTAPVKARVPAPAPSAAALPAPAPLEGEIVTQKRDTLWRIASRARPAGASMQQTMMAIHRNNPHAFARQNINGLLSGQVLRLPSPGQIDELSKQQAIQAVATQNEAWKTGSAAPLEAADTSAVQGAPSQSSQDSYMKLSSTASNEASAAGTSNGVDASGEVEAVRSELNAAQEKLDRANLENVDLDNRLDDLEGQIDTLEKLVELKDSQLAAMQGRLEQEGSDTQAAPVDQNFAEDAAGASPAAEQDSQPGVMDRLMSPMYLGGIGLLVLLAAAGLVLKRRSGDDDDHAEPAAVADTPRSDDSDTLLEALVAQPAEEEEVSLAEQEPAGLASELEEELLTAEQTPSADPLAQADAYCSYDRHDDAVALLDRAISAEPLSAELHLKLLSILVELDRQTEFQQAYAALQANGLDESLQAAQQLAAHKGWLESSAAAAPEFTLDELSDSTDTAINQELDDADLDFDLDFELDDAAQPDAIDLAVDNLELESEGDLDFNLELEVDAENEESLLDLSLEDAGEVPALDDLDFELDTAEGEPTASVDASALADMLESDASTDDDLSEMIDGDEIATKLDLARAYVDMGDVDGARDILEEVLQDGSEVQVEEANSLLSNLAS